MDPLIEMPREKWIELRNAYKTVWPRGAAAYCVLDTHISNPELSNSIIFKVYCLEGNVFNGMVAIVDSFGYYQLLINPINDILTTEEALKTTKVIDWDKEIVVPSADPEVIGIIERLQKDLGFRIRYDDKAYIHLLNDSRPLYDISDSPADSYVAPLKPQHISLIDSTWTYHSERTHKLFEILMVNDLTYVLYSKKDDQPMAWVVVDTEGVLTHLYTLEPYRRRGYAEFIIKYAANDLRKKGRIVLAYTLQRNEKAQKMFQKLNFDLVELVQWAYISKVT